MRKRELVALLLLSFGCLVTVNVPQIFFKMSLVGLLYVIVVFPYHTHLLSEILSTRCHFRACASRRRPVAFRKILNDAHMFEL